jgi:hypothetical protein
MLDDWLEASPVNHRSINDRLTGDILHEHKVRVAEITRRGITPPPKRCRVCGKLLPKPIGNPWSNNPGIGLIWGILLAGLVFGLLPVIGWWALFVFPGGWLVSQSFLWSIPLPFLILLLCSLFL